MNFQIRSHSFRQEVLQWQDVLVLISKAHLDGVFFTLFLAFLLLEKRTDCMMSDVMEVIYLGRSHPKTHQRGSKIGEVRMTGGNDEMDEIN